MLAELSFGNRWPRFVALVAGRWFLVDGAKRLWVTDGTPAGTRLVYTFDSGPEIFQGAAVGSRLVLLVGFSSSSFGGPQPWASDGTPEGTFQIEQLEKYAISTSGTPLLSTGSSVVFVANDSTTGIELRATDGTPGSLRTLTELCPPPGCSANFQLLVQAGAFAFFSARDSAGQWLWRTDGTPEGTFRLAQGSAREAVTVDGVAYLAGDKLWRTDGSVEGTVVLETDRVYSLGQPVDGAVPYVAGGTLRIARGTVTRVLTGVLPVTQLLGRTPSRAWVLFLVPGSLLAVDEDTGAQTVLPAPRNPTARASWTCAPRRARRRPSAPSRSGSPGRARSARRAPSPTPWQPLARRSSSRRRRAHWPPLPLAERRPRSIRPRGARPSQRCPFKAGCCSTAGPPVAASSMRSGRRRRMGAARLSCSLSPQALGSSGTGTPSGSR